MSLVFDEDWSSGTTSNWTYVSGTPLPMTGRGCTDALNACTACYSLSFGKNLFTQTGYAGLYYPAATLRMQMGVRVLAGDAGFAAAVPGGPFGFGTEIIAFGDAPNALSPPGARLGLIVDFTYPAGEWVLRVSTGISIVTLGTTAAGTLVFDGTLHGIQLSVSCPAHDTLDYSLVVNNAVLLSGTYVNTFTLGAAPNNELWYYTDILGVKNPQAGISEVYIRMPVSTGATQATVYAQMLLGKVQIENAALITAWPNCTNVLPWWLALCTGSQLPCPRVIPSQPSIQACQTTSLQAVRSRTAAVQPPVERGNY